MGCCGANAKFDEEGNAIKTPYWMIIATIMVLAMLGVWIIF